MQETLSKVPDEYKPAVELYLLQTGKTTNSGLLSAGADNQFAIDIDTIQKGSDVDFNAGIDFAGQGDIDNADVSYDAYELKLQVLVDTKVLDPRGSGC